MGLLDERAIVITGAAQGLGRAFALDAGARGAAVVVNDVDAGGAERTAAEIRAAGSRAVAHGGSVARWEDAESIIRRCVEEFGAIDGLVNNAGTFHFGPPWNESEAALRTIVSVNLLGHMFCGVHALRAMRERGRGAIVNLTSGAHVGMAGMSAYGATKGAIASLTYAWAIETHPVRIRVNAMSPIARTRMAALRGDRSPDAPGPSPEQIAPLASYLLSDRAARITGQVVRFDGRRLGILSQPHFPPPVLERDCWDLEAIGQALECDLVESLRPVGLGPAALDRGRLADGSDS